MLRSRTMTMKDTRTPTKTLDEKTWDRKKDASSHNANSKCTRPLD